MARSGRYATVDADFRRRAEERRSVAVPLALAALRALEAKGFRGLVIGSLAKGRFSPTSDVVFAVDCPREREREAFLIVERAMGDFPFHMVPCGRIKADAISYLMEGAVDAAGLDAHEAQGERVS